MPADRRQEIGIALYAQMFQKMPKCRKLFLRGDIDQTAKRFLGMMQWLIHQMYNGNIESQDFWQPVIDMGKKHREWGVEYHHFLPMLQAFHFTFHEV